LAPLLWVRDICALEWVSAFLSIGTDGLPSCVDILLKYVEWLIKPKQNNGLWVTEVNATFQPCSPCTLSSLKVVGGHFKDFFLLSKDFTDEQPLYNGFFMENEFIGGNVSLHAIYRFISQAYLVSQFQFFVSFNSTEQLYNVLMTWDIGLAILMSHR
jgi:hypothetical protein